MHVTGSPRTMRGEPEYSNQASEPLSEPLSGQSLADSASITHGWTSYGKNLFL
jgi:hypothetical protein